jgi:hypothetical protein
MSDLGSNGFGHGHGHGHGHGAGRSRGGDQHFPAFTLSFFKQNLPRSTEVVPAGL